jgi:hypothetical protein
MKEKELLAIQRIIVLMSCLVFLKESTGRKTTTQKTAQIYFFNWSKLFEQSQKIGMSSTEKIVMSSCKLLK